MTDQNREALQDKTSNRTGDREALFKSETSEKDAAQQRSCTHSDCSASRCNYNLVGGTPNVSNQQQQQQNVHNISPSSDENVRTNTTYMDPSTMPPKPAEQPHGEELEGESVHRRQEQQQQNPPHFGGIWNEGADRRRVEDQQFDVDRFDRELIGTGTAAPRAARDSGNKLDSTAVQREDYEGSSGNIHPDSGIYYRNTTNRNLVGTSAEDVPSSMRQVHGDVQPQQMRREGANAGNTETNPATQNVVTNTSSTFQRAGIENMSNIAADDRTLNDQLRARHLHRDDELLRSRHLHRDDERLPAPQNVDSGDIFDMQDNEAQQQQQQFRDVDLGDRKPAGTLERGVDTKMGGILDPNLGGNLGGQTMPQSTASSDENWRAGRGQSSVDRNFSVNVDRNQPGAVERNLVGNVSEKTDIHDRNLSSVGAPLQRESGNINLTEERNKLHGMQPAVNPHQPQNWAASSAGLQQQNRGMGGAIEGFDTGGDVRERLPRERQLQENLQQEQRRYGHHLPPLQQREQDESKENVQPPRVGNVALASSGVMNTQQAGQLNMQPQQHELPHQHHGGVEWDIGAPQRWDAGAVPPLRHLQQPQPQQHQHHGGVEWDVGSPQRWDVGVPQQQQHHRGYHQRHNVDRSLQHIYDELRTLNGETESIDAKDVKLEKVTSLQDRLRKIDEQYTEGKFRNDKGEVPAGQAELSEMLNTVHEKLQKLVLSSTGGVGTVDEEESLQAVGDIK